MNVRMVDAINFFDKGGFIDLQTGQYILPKYFRERFDHLILDNNLSFEKQLAWQEAFGTIVELSDYEYIERDSKRYISAPPVIRPSGIHCAAAKKLGLTREYLSTLGFTHNDCWDFFYPCKMDENLSCDILRTEDENASERLTEYMRQHDLYSNYIKTCIAVRHEIIRDWLMQRGIEVY